MDFLSLIVAPQTIRILDLCRKNLPDEEYQLIFRLIKEKKLKFSFLTSNCSFKDNDEIADLIYGDRISQVFLYDIVDKQIFIRSHIVSLITCPMQYLLLLMKIIEEHLRETEYGNLITIYGREYKVEGSFKLIQGQEVLEDVEIIKKFPWELEEDKYHFYKFDYKNENISDTLTRIEDINMSKFSY